MEYSCSTHLKSVPFGGKRKNRVADQVKMEVADILLKKAKDPRIGSVTVLSVDMSPDLSHAKVFISLPQSANEKAALTGLKKAAGFIRSELSRRLPLKRVPDISFVVDQSEEQVSRLLALLEQVGEEQMQKHCEEDREDRALPVRARGVGAMGAQRDRPPH
ncbi:MAG: 30S ribosome-binding factor RbfA [Nitrospirae bacterium]|nr:30S ribosome-binding factor RbfA [Candidatus Troglogloeales bacterium]MBI3598155.1 30S ribosome-binding factor RbfA [Candidatus Troglogloeales bacterium]